jgi:malate synthase
MSNMQGIKISGPIKDQFDQILTPEALDFVMALQRKFGPTREALLQARAERQAAANAGALPDFCPETAHVRSGDWKIAPLPADLQDRRVEITGPTERKMLINALNSGAKVFMADFEDSLTPTWQNIIEGQINLIDAIEGTISFTNPDGRVYRLGEKVATLIVRPRGWHLVDKNVLVDGQPISGSLLDFGLYLFHNARRLLA